MKISSRETRRLPMTFTAMLGMMGIVASVALGSATVRARAQTEKKKPAVAAQGVLVPDKGKLKILLDGQAVGSEDFEIAPSEDAWMARSTTEIHAPGAKITQVRSALRLQASGAPLRYDWSMQGERKAAATVAFQDGIAKTTLQFENAKPFVQELTFGSPLIAVLDNNVYHHYAILARIYDWNKKGTQTFPVLIPQDITPGTITVEAGGAQIVEGKSYETLKVTTADLEVHLFLDANHRLMRLEVPASKNDNGEIVGMVAVIRE